MTSTGLKLRVATFDQAKIEYGDTETWAIVDCTCLKATWRNKNLKHLPPVAKTVLDWLRTSPSFEVFWDQLKKHLNADGLMGIVFVSTGKSPMRAKSVQRLCVRYLEERGIQYNLHDAVVVIGNYPHKSFRRRGTTEGALSSIWDGYASAIDFKIQIYTALSEGLIRIHGAHADAHLANLAIRAKQQENGEELDPEVPEPPMSYLFDQLEEIQHSFSTQTRELLNGASRAAKMLDD